MYNLYIVFIHSSNDLYCLHDVLLLNEGHCEQRFDAVELTVEFSER